MKTANFASSEICSSTVISIVTHNTCIYSCLLMSYQYLLCPDTLSDQFISIIFVLEMVSNFIHYILCGRIKGFNSYIATILLEAGS